MLPNFAFLQSRLRSLVFVLITPVMALAAANSSPASLASSELKKHLQAGEELLQERKLDAAAREFATALDISPRNVEAQSNLGVIEFLRGSCATATAKFHAALQLNPKLWNVEALLGFCELREGKNSLGRNHLEEAFPRLTDPKLRVQTGLFLVQLYRQVGEVKRATATIGRLQELDGDNVDVQYGAYRLYSDLADQAVNVVSVGHPDSARLRQIVAQRLVETGDLAGAIQAYREALKIDPHLTGAHFELAEALSRKASLTPEESKETRRELEAALADNPQDAESECLLGELSLKNSNPTEAKEHLLKALTLEPRNPEVHLGMGRMYFESQQFEKAVAEFQTVIAAEPSNSQAHYLLSQAYSRLGRRDEANQEVATFRALLAAKRQLEDTFGRMKSREGSDAQNTMESSSH